MMLVAFGVLIRRRRCGEVAEVKVKDGLLRVEGEMRGWNEVNLILHPFK